RAILDSHSQSLFLLVPPSPPSTLFPYTTLFRSDRYELTMLGSALRDGTAQRRCVFEVFARRLPDGRRYGVVAGTARLLEALAELDRKSTRLNSSHVAISYAVFCLKKKRETLLTL